jgi:hypothetical protein
MFYDDEKQQQLLLLSHLCIHQKISNEKVVQKRVYKAGVNDKGKSQQTANWKASRYLQEKAGKKRTHA